MGESGAALWWKTVAADYNQTIADLGTSSGVPVIDVYSAFKDRVDCFADESHFNASGHVAAATFIADGLLPYLPWYRVGNREALGVGSLAHYQSDMARQRDHLP
jgi:hypothetical protein